jgi:RNA polymerase sigma-70 factor (ECF subfamily)
MIELAMRLEQDPAAFFRDHYERVYRFVASSTGLPDDQVEDLVQETLFQAWRDRDRFRTESMPLTWILAIAKHRVYDLRRRQDRAKAAEPVLRALAAIETDEIPEQVLSTEEMGQRVRSALDSMPPEYSDLLLLRYLAGRSVQAIADELGENKKATESRLHRAREALRKILKEGSDA